MTGRGPGEILDVLPLAGRHLSRCRPYFDYLHRRVSDEAFTAEWEAAPDQTKAIFAGAVTLSGAVAGGDLLWVSSSMIDLLDAAAPTFPDNPFSLAELPWPKAVMLLEKPVSGFSGADPFRLVCWSNDAAAAVEDHSAVFAGYSIHPNDPSGLKLHVQGWWEEGRTAADKSRGDLGLLELARWVRTLWAMVQQRIAVVESGRASRAEERRHQRATGNAEHPQIVVVRLRRPAGSRPDSEQEVSFVDWSHRWIVDGHWRNQYHPSTGERTPTWIAPYVKGPDDKPLIVKKKINAWVR